ncbi:MAG: GNAT family N-acetyltransferase [Pyrinomonadaceae bacterium]|jgi:ribosomal protein S18 acetylase RimI-like enzyme|nr:GNAT family N-acetyltransferase [Blastocatellia bacterium]MCW5958205.1 GNAT family N-acetyltransferase [Pyrinomonadaceae bacterium]
MAIEIRRPIEVEIGEIIRMMRDLAELEGLSDVFENSIAKLSDSIFARSAYVEALIAKDGDRYAGYALFFPFFASFRGQHGYYLDDLYIDPAFRGTGLGEALLREIARLGAERGFERIDLQVRDGNIKAISFYEKLGAVLDSEERHFKFTDAAFRNLAK